MSKRTDDRCSERDVALGALAPLAVLAVLVVLAAMFVRAQGAVPGRTFEGPADIRSLFYHPALIGQSLTVEMALMEFGGRSIGILTPRVTSFLLATILLTGLVGPVMLVLALRRKLLGERPVLLRASTVLGLVFGGFAYLMTIVTAVAFAWSSRELTSTVNISTTADKMIQEIYLLSLDARNHRVVPKWLGGGGGTYEGFIPAVPEGSTGRYSFRITPDRITVGATPTHDPRVPGGGSASAVVPEAEISAVIDSAGRVRDWKRRGLFE